MVLLGKRAVWAKVSTRRMCVLRIPPCPGGHAPDLPAQTPAHQGKENQSEWYPTCAARSRVCSVEQTRLAGRRSTAGIRAGLILMPGQPAGIGGKKGCPFRGANGGYNRQNGGAGHRVGDERARPRAIGRQSRRRWGAIR